MSFGGRDWSVQSIARHPGYYMNAHGDNLALIMLTMSKEMKQEQMPVCLIRNTGKWLSTDEPVRADLYIIWSLNRKVIFQQRGSEGHMIWLDKLALVDCVKYKVLLTGKD